MRLISTTLTRLGAALVLLAALVAVPLAAVALIGLDLGAISDAAGTGRLGTDAVVQLGLAVFLLLWVWFVATVLSEAVRVLRWRRAPRHVVLRPTMPSPTGWVRGLVRVALISSTVVVAPLPGGAVQHIRPATVLADDVAVSPFDATGSPSTLRSNGRETPYSVAVRLGDTSLRDTIIDLNRGRPTPDGGAWTSGVFPEGMTVHVPEGALAPRPTTAWVTHTVSEGESVYRIAATLAGGDSRRVRDLADQIIDRNLGRTMADGRLFDDPSLIRPGWTLEVPVEGAGPVVDADAVVEAIGPERTHVVTAGESYWSIADSLVATDGPSDVVRTTAALIADNALRLGHDDESMIHPGDVIVLPSPTAPQDEVPPTDVPVTTVPPTDVPATTVPVTTVPVTTVPVTTVPVTTVADLGSTVADPDRSAPIGRTLGGALLVCAGALGLLEVRRRHRLRRAPSGSYVPEPPVRYVVTERVLRSLGASERAVRLDLALRAAGHALGGSGGFVRAAIMSDLGDVTVVLDRPGHQPSGVWSADTRPDRWHLHAHVTTDELVATARLAGQPCPAVVHVGALVADGGREASGDVFVDLEAFGVLSIDGPESDTEAVLRAIAASLAMSPVGEDLHVVTHRVELPAFDEERLVSSDDLDRALDLAASFIGSTPTVAGSRRTFELRSRGIGGESWEPVVVLSGDRGRDPAIEDELRALAGGGRGLAVVVGRPLGDTATSASLVAGPSGWMLRPLDLVVVPAGLDAVELAAVAELVADADRPLPMAEPVDIAPVDIARAAAFVEPDWAVMVRVLGGVRVVDRAGADIRFERGRALELLAWLATHRARPTRSAARAAMWQLDVRDATFANVVSDARRGLARAVPPPDGTEWIARTLTDDLPLHDLVVTDADVLRARLDAARGLHPIDAVAVLEPGLELVDGLPFAGGDHLWPDAEGITSSLIVLATGAAAELARLHLELGDIDGVFRATGRGLAVLGGHEELIGLRMRAHAMRGNLAGVRHEWAFYERALDADPWNTSDPSPTLLRLRRELLSS